ncbi:MAG: hypothetical protein WBM83_08660 [Flavobacteriaceae bacterium]
MEQAIKTAVYVHAFFGGLGLLTGIASMIFKKGGALHKRTGKLFSIGMLTSSCISLPIACMPGHENTFLFLIGLFTIYMVLAGNRSLNFKPKRKPKAATLDYVISGSMLIISMIMMGLGVLGLISGTENSVLFSVFGGFGILLTIGDFIFYKKFKEIKNAWLLNHISRMMGALIASVTAFIIAGAGIGSLVAWILPSVIGTFYIIFWQRKYKVKAVPQL